LAPWLLLLLLLLLLLIFYLQVTISKSRLINNKAKGLGGAVLIASGKASQRGL
jgi:hypothetical protein